MTEKKEKTSIDEVRDKLVKLFSSFSAGLVTVLTMYMTPFMPQNLIFTLLVGFCVAIIGHKSPRSSASFITSIMIISALYQFAYAGFLTFLFKGGFILVIFLWVLCLSFGTLSVDLHESLIAFCLGYTAFLVLFTGIWYLAIPLILLPSVFSRGFRKGLTTVIFSLLYLPFQITAYAANNLAKLAQTGVSEFVKLRPELLSLNPPFDPANKGTETALGFLKPLAEPLNRLTLDEFIDKIGTIPQAMSGGSEGFFGLDLKTFGVSTYDIYNNIGLVYLNNIGSIALLILAIAASISLAYITLPLLSRFKPKFRDQPKEFIYDCFKPITSAVVSMALFTALFSGLSETLNYISPFLQTSIQFAALGFIAVLAALPSSLKTILDYSEMRIKLESEYLRSLKQLEDDTLELKSFLSRLSKIDREIGITALYNSLQILSERMHSLSIRVSRLDLKNLQEVRESINQFANEKKAAGDDVMTFASNYILQQIKFLKETTFWTMEMEWLRKDDEIVKALEEIKDNELSIQSVEESERLLAEITKIADTLAHRLMSLHEETRTTLQNIFHTEIKLTIDIEQSILKSIEATLREGKPWSALRIIRGEIESVEATHSEKVKELRFRLGMVIEKLKKDADELIHSKLKPLFAQRFASLSSYDNITAIAKEEAGGVTSVIGLRKVLENSKEQAFALARTTCNLVAALQKEVAQKSPVELDRLLQISKIHGKPHEICEKMEKMLAKDSESGEEIVSNLQRVLQQDLLALLELLWDYAVLKERILNYPTAEAAIFSTLKDQKRVSIGDLPFAKGHSSWYLKLYKLRKERHSTSTPKKRAR